MIKRATHLLGTAIRETGQAVDRLGLMVTGNDIYKEAYSRHRPVMNIYDKLPVTAIDSFVAPNASVIGKVIIPDKSSVWYGAVVRGDRHHVILGTRTAVLDRAVISCVTELESGFPAVTTIGSYVTIGPGALITSATIEDEVSVGAGAVIDVGCVIEKQSIVTAGSVVTAGTLIPSGQVWSGNPAKFVRNISDSEKLAFQTNAEALASLASEHSQEFLPFGTLYQQAEKQ